MGSQTKNQEEKMALNINTFSPFSMRSAFDNSFFSNRWNDDWMVPMRNLDNQFKEFRSLFNKEEAKVEEDNTDGGQDRRLRVQAGGVESLCAIRKTSRARKTRGEEGGRQRLHPEELLKELHLPKEAEADKMVSNLSSEGILVITTPKSAPALTDATHEAK